MWGSPPFSPARSVTAPGNGFSLQGNQPHFPPRIQQQVIHSVPKQHPRVGAMSSFQHFAPSPVLPSPSNPPPVHKISPRDSQMTVPHNQPNNHSLMQQPSPRGMASLFQQNSTFNNPLQQVPSPGVVPQQPRMPFSRPSSGELVASIQRSLTETSHRGIMPSTIQSSTFGVVSLPHQPSNVPTLGRVLIRPQQPGTCWAVPSPTRSMVMPPGPFTSSAIPVPTQAQIPLSSQQPFLSPNLQPSTGVPSSQKETSPEAVLLSGVRQPPPTLPPRQVIPYTMAPTRGTHLQAVSPGQFAPSTVQATGRMHSLAITPGPPSSMPPNRGINSPAISPRTFVPPSCTAGMNSPTLAPRAMISDLQQRGIRPFAAPQRMFMQSSRQPSVGTPSSNLASTLFTPCTVPSPGGAQSSPPVQMRFTPHTSPSSGGPPPRRVLPPPQQSLVPATSPVPRVHFSTGITSPGQQTLPNGRLQHNTRPFRPRNIPTPVQPQLVFSNSRQQLRNLQPSVYGLNQGFIAPVPQNGTNGPMQQMQPPVAPGQRGHVRPPQLAFYQQFSPISQSTFWRRPTPSSPRTSTSRSKDGKGRRDHEYRRNYHSSTRATRCFSPPPPDIERVIKCKTSQEYYIKKQNEQDNKYHLQGTEQLVELHSTFEREILNMTSLEQTDSDTESINTKGSQQKNVGDSDMDSLIESEDDDNDSLAKSRLRLFPSDEEGTSDDDSSGIESRALSDSNFDSDNDDDSNAEEGITDDDVDDDRDEGCHKGPSVAEIRKRKIEDPRRLHPEIWFNEIGETNDGPVCRCSSVDRKRGIRHGVYPGETAIKLCDPLTNNSDKVYHYWITVTPHSNFMTSNPSVIHAEGKDYTFEGFSMFSHHPLEKVPLCSVIRFNIEYTLHIVSQPIPESFCMKDLDLFSKFLFYQVLELADWDFNGNIDNSCQRYHFMPRFVHRSTHKYDSKECHELLAMSQVLSHIISSAQPLIQLNHFDLSEEKWEEYSKSCMNFIVMNPAKKPGAIRVDNLRFSKTDKDESTKSKEYPSIIHHSVRPVQMSFAGDPKYQRLLRTHNKLRSLISNTPVPSRKNQDKLVKLKIELEKMRLTSSMRRDTVVEISSKGMIKTGLKSDICQHALLLPVIVHHVRYHQCLHSLDKKVGYEFKNRALLQLALTHPSYYLNFGLNPDHARNSLTNCGVKKPRYGDWKVRLLHTRKKGITQLIRVMSNLGKMEEHQSMIRHNERLEFLGDAVLELICSAHLYFMLPYKSEGGLAIYRSALVQNKHLAQLAQKLGLSDYMQYSHGPDLCLEEDLKHAMANCLEAILGAIYLEGGLKPATELFTKLTFDDEELRDVWTNLPQHPLQARQPDGDRHLIASSELLQKLQEFEQVSGIEFTHISLLARAFTHAQVGFNNLTLGSNQRMEFLGDSVLQFVVSVYLFKHFPEHHEGHLTLLRSSLVNHRVQAKLSRELGLDKLINFGAQVEMKVFREKLLADILEAFVAALYVDKGLKYVEVLCRVCLFPRLEEFIINQDWMDAKSQLQQCCLTSREEGKTPDLPQYRILQNKGPAHHKHYTVAVYLKNRRLGSGSGKSIQQAEMAAAKDALASHYFPELARQKRLLDRKHQGRRRNYWNKVPRSESEKKDQKDEEFIPQWEEMETFESQDEYNAVEKQHGNGRANENWEMETNDDRENWEEEFSSGDEEGFDKRRISEEKNIVGQENLEKQSCQEEQIDSGEIWDSENDNLLETEEGEKYDARENWKDDLNNAKENWEEEEINRDAMWDEERGGRENWENETMELQLQETWEEEPIDKMKN